MSGGTGLLHAVGVVSEPEDEHKLDGDRVIEGVGFADETVANHIISERI